MISKIYEKIKDFIKENYKSLIVLVLVVLLFTVELPYSIYTPGGAVNLNDRITVDNSYKIDGSFNMAYVSMVKGSIPFLLISKVLPDWDIVKKEDITYEGEDMDEMMERERLQLQNSVDSAIINAYKKAGKEIKVLNFIDLIVDDAKTDLQKGDLLLSIEGNTVESLSKLKEIVKSYPENTKLSIKVKREDKEIDCYATTFKIDNEMKIGISIVTTYDELLNPEIKVKTKSSEMGSSGGLMMSLTIYNKLVEEDITKGKKIVGTGTIDAEGNVGEIGGVKYKLIGAVKNKADIFICPEENYEEALRVAKDKDYDIKIINVKTFDEALAKLESM